MQYCEAKPGSVFVHRLEHGDIVHEEIERFAREKGICAAVPIAVGGAGAKSALGVGPKDGDARPIDPMAHLLGNVREILGTGTFFEDGEGNPFCTCILPAAGPKGLWPAVFKAG